MKTGHASFLKRVGHAGVRSRNIQNNVPTKIHPDVLKALKERDDTITIGSSFNGTFLRLTRTNKVDAPGLNHTFNHDIILAHDAKGNLVGGYSADKGNRYILQRLIADELKEQNTK